MDKAEWKVARVMSHTGLDRKMATAYLNTHDWCDNTAIDQAQQVRMADANNTHHCKGAGHDGRITFTGTFLQCAEYRDECGMDGCWEIVQRTMY